MHYNIKIILIVFILLSCDNKGNKNYNSPRIVSKLKITSPSYNEVFKKGDSIKIEVSSNSKTNKLIESIFYLGNDSVKFLNTLNISSNELIRYGRHIFSLVSKFLSVTPETLPFPTIDSIWKGVSKLTLPS